MVRSTFNRHKDAIQEIFGLIIDCTKKNGYKYYISNAKVLQENSIQNWMFSTITVSNVIRESVSLQNRIVLENVPSTKGYLQTILKAMKNERKLSISYKKYNDMEAKSYLLEPYCLKLYRQRWYLLGHMVDNSLRVFSLDRLDGVETKKETFKFDMTVDAEVFFRDCFGVFHDSGHVFIFVTYRCIIPKKKYPHRMNFQILNTIYGHPMISSVKSCCKETG